VFLDPERYAPLRSLYRDDAHTAALAATWNWPKNRGSVTGGREPVPFGGFAADAVLISRWRGCSCRCGSRCSYWESGGRYRWGRRSYAYNEAFGVQQITIGLRLGR
jgi:hypothetical protein